MNAGPLSGVTVVDMTRALAGPYCTMLLADLGADVIKIEPPAGDHTRELGPYVPEDDTRLWGGYFQSVNRNKRSIVADLRSSDGQATVRKLAARADALVENFRAGVMDAMGLSYEELSAANPKLVYGALRGFGDPRTGASPYVDRPAFDVVAQAMGGIMGITGDPGKPTKIGPGVGDIFPAALTAVGVLSGIIEARSTGRGRFVDVSMYDAVVSMCERAIYQYSYLDVDAGGEGNDHPLLCPFGLYRAADGWVTIAAPRDHQWQKLAAAMGRAELGTDPKYATNAARVAAREDVRAVIEGWTRPRTRTEITDAIADRVPCGPVNTAASIYRDPHVHIRDMLVELEQPGAPRPVTVAGQPIKFTGERRPFRRAPLLGEHTAEVTAELAADSPAS